MKRIVCDTNVVISGMLWRGTPRQILTTVEQGKVAMFTSRILLDELDRVLRYSRIVSVLNRAGLGGQDVLRWLVGHATLVMSKPVDGVVVKADPSDDHVLACAVAASADFIVSGDKHILDLRSYMNIPVVSASRFLRKLS